jgi:hypothetical protein
MWLHLVARTNHGMLAGHRSQAGSSQLVSHRKMMRLKAQQADNCLDDIIRQRGERASADRNTQLLSQPAPLSIE